jgi:hypothetical protein
MKEISNGKVCAGFVGMLVIGVAILMAMRWLSMSLDWYLQACAVIVVALFGVLVVQTTHEFAMRLKERRGTA